jgi:hypothetical protein
MPTPVSRKGADPQPGIWPEAGDPLPPEERKVYPGEGVVLMEEIGDC